jgi:hypothetical protein
MGRQLGMTVDGCYQGIRSGDQAHPDQRRGMLRKLQSKRQNVARRRVYAELAGRTEQVSGPANPGQMKTVTIRPTVEQSMEAQIGS